MNKKELEKIVKNFSVDIEDLFNSAGKGLKKFLEPPRKR